MKLPLIESVNKSPKDISGEYFKNKFNDFILERNLNYEHVSCLCNYDDDIIISKKDEFGLPQNNVMCKSCGLIYSNPRLTAESFNVFYSSDIYREIYDGDSNYKNRAYARFSIDSGQYIFDIINSNTNLTSNSKILDFGCGGGWNLIPFRDFGSKCFGVDYSESLVKMGKEKGFSIIKGGINEVRGTYDVILLCHVFEHFLNPLKDLKQLMKHLNPDGIIYIEVPNINNLSAGQMHVPHTYCYSPETFKYYVEKSGLKTIEFGGTHQNYHMYGVFKFSNSASKLSKPFFKSALKVYQKFIFKEKIKNILRKIYLFNIFKKMLK